MMISFRKLLQWTRHGCLFLNPVTKYQSQQQKHCSSLPPIMFCITASAEMMMVVAMYCDSDDVILAYCVPTCTTVTAASQRCNGKKLFAQSEKESNQKRQHLLSSIMTMLWLIGQFFKLLFVKTTLRWFLMPITPSPRTQGVLALPDHEKDALCSRVFSTHSTVASEICQWPWHTLEKPSLWPCSRAVNFAKDALNCRVAMHPALFIACTFS